MTRHADVKVPSGLVGLAADKDFETLAALGNQEMVIYDISSGARESVFLTQELYREVSLHLRRTWTDD
jgi:hypothetical protein